MYMLVALWISFVAKFQPSLFIRPIDVEKKTPQEVNRKKKNHCICLFYFQINIGKVKIRNLHLMLKQNRVRKYCICCITENNLIIIK